MLAALWPGAAAGQTGPRPGRNCDLHDAIVERLSEKYDEYQVAVGVSLAHSLIVVFTTEDGSTWTIVEVRPDGWACVVSAGEWWRVGLSHESPASET